MRAGLSILVMMMMAACATAPRALPPPALPNVALTRLDGKSTTLTAAIAGRPALVTLWATWCEACRAEFTPLSRLHARAPDAAILAIAVGQAPGEVQPTIAREKLQYEHLLDENFALADALGSRRIPTTFVVDRHGAIVYRGGEFNRDALAALRHELESP